MVLTCSANRTGGRDIGQPCGGFLGEWPDWMRPSVVGRVRHSSRRAPDHLVCPCKGCGALHEIRLAGVRKTLAQDRAPA